MMDWKLKCIVSCEVMSGINGVSGIRVNLTPISQMNSETFARKMTGGETLSSEQKKQIREQQEVCTFVIHKINCEFQPK